MRSHGATSCVVVALLLICTLSVSWAQLGENAQRARAGLTNVIGIRATGMGGTAVAAPEPGTALYWNPAALASQRGTRFYGSIGGSAEGLDTADDLADVVEIIDDAPENLDSLGLQDYLTIRDIIQRNSGTPIRGELGLLGSVEFKNFAIGYWAMAGGDASVQYTAPAQNNNIERVDWDATAVGQAGAGAAYGKELSSKLDVGLTARMAVLGRAVADGFAQATWVGGTPGSPQYQSTTQDTENDDSFTVDLGVLYNINDQSRIGLVGRNLTEPSFDLGLAQDLELEASVDLGYAWMNDNGEIFAIDVHNVTEANGSGNAVSVGVNDPLADWLHLRLGYGHNRPTVGLGFDFGSLQIDLASALDWEDRVGIAGSLTF